MEAPKEVQQPAFSFKLRKSKPSSNGLIVATSESEINNDGNKTEYNYPLPGDNVDIFRVLTNRYIKTAYPILLEVR